MGKPGGESGSPGNIHGERFTRSTASKEEIFLYSEPLPYPYGGLTVVSLLISRP